MTNQLQIISRKLTEFETKTGNGYKNWVSWFSKQSFPVQATVFTTANAINGAACGSLVAAVAQVAGNVFPEHSLAIKAKFSPTGEARLWAAVLGAHAGIDCIMRKIRGKEDIGDAEGYPYVTGNAVTLGIAGALIGGIIFQLGQKNSQPVEYTRTRCMLSNLGLQNYEKNFKKGFVLKDVGVPPGPSLRILDHIERY
ncbi:hypothetical protein MKW92_009856 [Papaver armeniacum]|nr:hypothetical protein MKW92_009856 [Papaver armeniacum]